jgi:DNA helicase-2/ATP-dependent DNA helicase PcrA
MALSTTDGLEEERRLFYVATTRPRRQLWMYVPLRFHHHPRGRDDLHTYAQRSRFLSDRVVAQFDVVGDTPAEPERLHEPMRARAVDLALDALWS